jgi:RNA-binding protein PNO1
MDEDNMDMDADMIDAGDVEAEAHQQHSAQLRQKGIQLDERGQPIFAPISAAEMLGAGVLSEERRISVPPHRLTPLKTQWLKICQPIVEHMKLQVRYNPKRRCVEIRTCPNTIEGGAIQKAEDFVKAFVLGFAVDDAVALLRVEDLYVDSFEVDDVKSLHGEHLARAIGRIAGKDGSTKFTIENATRTRIVLADRKVHILGSFANIRIARDAIVELIRGAPAGKVYGKLRTISARMNERF